jgi:heterodisulfide reductase subunit C
VADTVEVRCPVGPRRLFTKLKLGEESGRYIHPENLIELTCCDCRNRLRRASNSVEVVRVLHRYNFVGELIETVAVHDGGFEQVLSGDPG